MRSLRGTAMNNFGGNERNKIKILLRSNLIFAVQDAIIQSRLQKTEYAHCVAQARSFCASTADGMHEAFRRVSILHHGAAHV